MISSTSSLLFECSGPVSRAREKGVKGRGRLSNLGGGLIPCTRCWTVMTDLENRNKRKPLGLIINPTADIKGREALRVIQPRLGGV